MVSTGSQGLSFVFPILLPYFLIQRWKTLWFFEKTNLKIINFILWLFVSCTIIEKGKQKDCQDHDVGHTYKSRLGFLLNSYQSFTENVKIFLFLWSKEVVSSRRDCVLKLQRSNWDISRRLRPMVSEACWEDTQKYFVASPLFYSF